MITYFSADLKFQCTSAEKTILEEVTLLQHLSLQEFEPIDSLKVSLEQPRQAEQDLINAMRTHFGRDFATSEVFILCIWLEALTHQ